MARLSETIEAPTGPAPNSPGVIKNTWPTILKRNNRRRSRDCLNAVLGLVIVLGGCENGEGSCAAFPERYERISIQFYQLEGLPLIDGLVQRSANRIIECSPRHPYAGQQDTMRMISAHRLNEREVLLVFELHGISDLRLLFKVDLNGDIVGAYHMSMT